MKTIMITGAAGHIGGSLARHFIKNKNNRVIGIDNLQTGKKENLPPENTENFRFIKADVNYWNDISPVFFSFQFDYIFHYAATVGVKRTLENPIMVLNDIHGIENILKLSKSANVRRVFFTSSSEVYGEPVETPQKEATTPLNSRLPYAIVKNLGEAYVKSFYEEYNLPYTILRLFNTYGPLQSDDFVISKFLNLAKKDDDIPLYGGGQQTRTFCYIDDNLELTTKLLEEGKGINETLNVGNDGEFTIRQLAEKIIKLTNSKSRLVNLPPLPDGDMTRRLPEISKMREILGRDLTSIDVGLKKLI